MVLAACVWCEPRVACMMIIIDTVVVLMAIVLAAFQMRGAGSDGCGALRVV